MREDSLYRGGWFCWWIGGGSAAVALTSPAVGSICAAIGIGSGGLGGVVCGLVVVAGASYAGGKGGKGSEWFGGLAGEEIYKVQK